MSTKWEYIIGPVALVLIIGGLTGLLLSVDLTATTYALSTGMPVRLEAAWVLLRQGIVISLGPVVLTATPFQLAYCVLSVCLTCLAILICLVNCFFYRGPASSESKATTTQARKQTNKQSGVTNENQKIMDYHNHHLGPGRGSFLLPRYADHRGRGQRPEPGQRAGE